MDKVKFYEIQKAWKRFDASTALGCAQKSIPFNEEACKESWLHYNVVLASYDIPPFPPLSFTHAKR